MRNFILGIIFTFFLTILAGLAITMLGLFPTSADATPPKIETRIVSGALDASMDRYAPRVDNPIPLTDANLIEGMKIYTMNCALCHGGLDHKPSVLEHSFYPPPPQIILEPLDDPEWHLFFAIRTGVRYTGMPAWRKALKEEDMWKVTAFLSHIDKLPGGAKEYWQKSFGVAPGSGGEGRKGGHQHQD